MSEPGPLDKAGPEEHVAQLRAAIAAQEALRSTLGDAIVDATIAALQEQLAALERERERARPAPQRAERKLVTILFADLAGFTPLVEQSDPETARQLMNACFDALKEVLDRYGGHIDKYIGDEIMVLFGAPVAYEDHAERALRAALEMQSEFTSWKREAGETSGLQTPTSNLQSLISDLQLHIGVNTGLVIAGGIGAQAHQQYSVVGDAVNVAARLTDLSEAGQILVGETTYQLTAPLFEFISLPPVQLKGKREPQKVYRLRRPRDRPGRIRGLEPLGLHAPLVGRAVEIGHLREAVARLQEGRGSVISIVGEAGVGKSRLVAELRKQASLPWYEGRCLSYGQMLSYHPFLALLRSLIGVAPEAELSTLEAHLGEFLEDLFPNQMAATYPYLADLLGLPLDVPTQERINNLSGESRQWQAFQVFEEMLSHLAQRSPTVIVMEDLHWADPTSLVLLEQMLLLSQRRPILFLLVLRPYCGPLCQRLLDKLRAAPTFPYEEISLTPLDATHSRELIEQLLVIEALPPAVRDSILSRAEGNPLFLEEILRALIGQGVLRRENGHWRADPELSLEEIALPQSLQGVILARLDRLEAETKAVLQMAAVVGRIFWYRVLNYVTAVEQQLQFMLDQHLASLERVELIRQTRRQPDLEYIFKHVLIQEAAYYSLLRERRRLFHQRVAAAIETIFTDNLDEQYGLLAHHYEAAGQIEQAIHYLRLAGDRARRTYTLAEAEEFYRRALKLLPPEEEDTQRHLLLDLGLVSLTRGDFAAAGEHYATSFQLQQKSPGVLRRSYARRPLRLCWAHPPRILEPGIPVDIYSGRVIEQLFAGLVGFDAELNIIPHMAERWEVDAQGRRYRFRLRRDARWSDGRPLSADDFVFAWHRWLHPETHAELAHMLYVLKGAADYHQGRTDDPTTIGVRALDERTLEIDLEDAVAYFLPLAATPAFWAIPRHSWPPPRSLQEDPTGLVVNGPFLLAEWQQDEKIVLQRNPHYCGFSQGNVARIEVTFSAISQERLALYTADEVDVCSVQPAEEANFRQAIPPEQWLRRPVLSTLYCALVPNAPPLDDRRIRRALMLAVDRSLVATQAATELGIPARGGLVPSGLPGHSPELNAPYAPERARALLREAGYENGSDLPPLKFAAATSLRSSLPQVLFSQWQQELGLQIAEEDWSIAELVGRLEGDPPHLFSMIWIADYPDPHNFLAQAIFSGSVWPEPTYWDLARQAAQTLDVRRRMALYHELDRRLVVEEALYIPLAYGRVTVVKQPRVRHFPLPPVAISPMKNVLIDE